MPDPRIAEILAIISQNNGIPMEKLQFDTTLDELGLTSLKLIEAVFEIEERYDVEISTDNILMTQEVTVGELTKRVLDTIDAKLLRPKAMET
jgi:acyl carrier protein